MSEEKCLRNIRTHVKISADASLERVADDIEAINIE